MREETRNWWEQAQKDLRASKNSLISGDYEWACFQSNQAAEKSLKAFFLEEKKAIVPSHNLISLGKMLNVPKDILDSLKELNAEYTISRYPDAANAIPFEIYTEKKAKEKINHAEIILKWIQKQLNL